MLAEWGDSISLKVFSNPDDSVILFPLHVWASFGIIFNTRTDGVVLLDCWEYMEILCPLCLLVLLLFATSKVIFLLANGFIG